jgi:hypothetical protein
MTFTSQRGRPRKTLPELDAGTPELRLKHALGLTLEPIDLCREKLIITPEQHWCGLHLRWLYTLRYGVPSLTARYTDRNYAPPPIEYDDPTWRALREKEYREAIRLLKNENHYEGVMRLVVYNEVPNFLNARLQNAARTNHDLQMELEKTRTRLCIGLDLLANQWRKIK